MVFQLRKFRMLLAIAIGLTIDWFYPTLDLLILFLEIVMIIIIISRIDMEKYIDIYNRMDKNEQKLVHKLLGLLAACLLVPTILFIIEAYKFIEQTFLR